MEFFQNFVHNAIKLDTQKISGIHESVVYQCSNNANAKCIKDSKFLWVIGRTPGNSTVKTETIVHITDFESQFSVEFQTVQQSPGSGHFNSGYFKLSSSVHKPDNQDKTEVIGKIRSRISILHNDNSDPPPSPLKSQVIISKWMPVVNCTFYLFDDNKTILDSILTTDKLIEGVNICGTQYNNFILVGIEFESLNEVYPGSFPKSQELALLTMDKIFNTKPFADLEILVINIKTNEDGTLAETKTSIMAHKAILSAQSTVFETMLQVQSPFTESKHSVIEILDFEPRIIQELLKYLYTGNPDLENFALDLLRISDKYDIQKLMEICQLYIGSHILKFGWTCIFKLIHTYEKRVGILGKNVIQYYKNYESSLKKSPDFIAAMYEYPKIFIELYIKST